MPSASSWGRLCDASQLAPSPLPPLCRPAPEYVHNDVILWNLVPRVLLLELPSEWGVFHRLFWCFLLTIAHPGAAHLHRYNLLLVVYYPRINSVGPKILVLSVDWDVPVCLCVRSLIYQLWLSWWIPRWRRLVPGLLWCQRKGPSELRHALPGTLFGPTADKQRVHEPCSLVLYRIACR